MAEISTPPQLHLWIDGLAHKKPGVEIFAAYIRLQANVFRRFGFSDRLYIADHLLMVDNITQK